MPGRFDGARSAAAIAGHPGWQGRLEHVPVGSGNAGVPKARAPYVNTLTRKEFL